MTRATRAGRSWRAALGAAVVVGAGSLWPATGAVAEGTESSPEARSLVAAASAQGIRVTYTVPDLFVVSQFIDGGGPIAQSTVDTTGKAIGFASAPYPGENGVTAPGLVSFVTGAPVPGYPFYARADHPVQPSSEVKDPSGTYVLTAAADAGKATGSANFAFGGVEKPVSRSTSDASGTLDATGAKVTAVAVNEGLSFGDGALRIASVTSRSVSTYTAGEAKPQTKSELLIEGARVGDQPVTIGPDGVHPGGQTVPVPFGEGAKSLNQALAQSGISVKTISSENLEGGAVSEALEVTVKHPVPGAQNVQGTFVYQIGGSSSFIAFGTEGPGLLPLPEPVPSDASAGTPPADTASAAGTTTDSGFASDSSAAADAAGDSFSTALGSSSSAFGGSTSGDLSSGADSGADGSSVALAPGQPVTGEATPLALARDFRDSTRLLFVILVVAGALLLASSSLWQAKGVLASWRR